MRVHRQILETGADFDSASTGNRRSRNPCFPMSESSRWAHTGKAAEAKSSTVTVSLECSMGEMRRHFSSRIFQLWLNRKSCHCYEFESSVLRYLGEHSLSGQVLSQVVGTVESLAAAGICASILLLRIVTELMASAVFGSGKHLK
jgi:hypothetical protein